MIGHEGHRNGGIGPPWRQDGRVIGRIGMALRRAAVLSVHDLALAVDEDQLTWSVSHTIRRLHRLPLNAQHLRSAWL